MDINIVIVAIKKIYASVTANLYLKLASVDSKRFLISESKLESRRNKAQSCEIWGAIVAQATLAHKLFAETECYSPCFEF